MKRDSRIELDIQSLALGGNGVGRLEQLVVFVPGAYPGERVRARVVKRRSHWIEAALEAVERAAPERVCGPCRHFTRGECGGCRSQDYAYPAQVAAKTQQVKETLARVGGLRDVEVADCVPAPEAWRYRNKMEFSFHPGPDGAPLLGLHRRDRFDDVFDLEECWIASELTNEIVRVTRAFARSHGWVAYHQRHHTGVARFLVVRHLPTTNQVGVHLVVSRDALPGVDAWAREVAALDPAAVKSVVLSVNDARANVAFGEGERVLYGVRAVEERLLGLGFEAGPNAFLQTNSLQAEALYTAALEEASLTGAETVLDLYCGAGTISLALARHARLVVGVEAVESAIDDARANAAKNGVANARFAAGDARAVLRVWAKARAARAAGREAPTPSSERARDAKAPSDPAAYEPIAPDVVIVDPPRAGLHERVIERVCELAPERVVYVSCNPGTLARDLALFAKGAGEGAPAGAAYRTVRVRPFDMFPHTPHIECVARLERIAG